MDSRLYHVFTEANTTADLLARQEGQDPSSSLVLYPDPPIFVSQTMAEDICGAIIIRMICNTFD